MQVEHCYSFTSPPLSLSSLSLSPSSPSLYDSDTKGHFFFYILNKRNQGWTNYEAATTHWRHNVHEITGCRGTGEGPRISLVCSDRSDVLPETSSQWKDYIPVCIFIIFGSVLPWACYLKCKSRWQFPHLRRRTGCTLLTQNVYRQTATQWVMSSVARGQLLFPKTSPGNQLNSFIISHWKQHTCGRFVQINSQM